MVLGGGACCAMIITIAVLVGVSFHVIQPNYVGFDYSGLSLTVDKTTLWTEGRHMTGPNHQFYVFPTTEQTVQLNAPGRTKDGLDMTYDVSFQYLLKADTESLFELYQMFGIPNFESTDLAAEGDADAGDDEIRRLKEDDEDEGEGETDKDGGVTDGKDEKANNIASSANYESAVIAMATSALSQATGKYTAFQCVKNYESLWLTMQEAVADKLGAFHMVVNRLQLLDITLPQEFKDAVDATTVAEQEATSLTYQKVSADITAQANIEQAKINAELTLYQANHNADGIHATGQAKAEAIAKQLAEEAATFEVVQQTFETNVWEGSDTDAQRQQQLITYIWLESLKATSAGHMVYNVDKPNAMKMA